MSEPIENVRAYRIMRGIPLAFAASLIDSCARCCRKSERTRHALDPDLCPFRSLVAFYTGGSATDSCPVWVARRSKGEPPLMRDCRSFDRRRRGGLFFWNSGIPLSHEVFVRCCLPFA